MAIVARARFQAKVVDAGVQGTSRGGVIRLRVIRRGWRYPWLVSVGVKVFRRYATMLRGFGEYQEFDQTDAMRFMDWIKNKEVKLRLRVSQQEGHRYFELFLVEVLAEEES